ncbi:N-glycosylation protein-domain-containing protein [Nemania sp. NC0429]|nr:N-glycosylation protein-domain-containing protein [Nemania sp. NC0429]
MDRPRSSPLSATSISNGQISNGQIPNGQIPTPQMTNVYGRDRVYGHGQGHDYDHAYDDHRRKHAGPVLETQARSISVSLLEPRLAVLLGLPKRWYRTLSICRLFCLVPCFWWGLRIALRFLVALVLQPSRSDKDEPDEGVASWLTETLLAGLWCLASATLAFYFTDCLMSRWLINYTPQATMIRLVTISCVFAYLTSWIVHLAGGAKDPRLLLPAWICIATILTACYHYTQRKIPVRKEAFASMSVFSIASFISMVALLLDMNATRSFPKEHVPLISFMRTAVEITAQIVVKILGVNKDNIGI